MSKSLKYLSFCILTLIMGFAAGAVCWGLLKVMNLGTDLIWDKLPETLGAKGGLAYSLVVCLSGGLIIGFMQKKCGVLPDTTEQVLGRIKKEGKYPYNRLHIIAIAFLLPLLFGGSVGPEAGLTGFIAGLCCLIADRLRYKAEQLAALAETGFAASLSVIFGAPFFGLAANLEPDDKTESYKGKFLNKRKRIIIYCFGIAGGMLAFWLLGALTGLSTGLPRFPIQHEVTVKQWLWAFPIMGIGICLALYYGLFAKITGTIGKKLAKHRIASCLIPGAALALCSYFFPLTMFSGEKQMHEMIDMISKGMGSPGSDLLPGSAGDAVFVFVMTVLIKLILISLCVNLGLKGWNIFPLIFCGTLAACTVSWFIGIDYSFAAAVLIASMYGYLTKKPVMAIAILLLCFPVTYIVPLAAAAFIASKIPSPFHRKGAGGKDTENVAGHTSEKTPARPEEDTGKQS